MSHLLITWNISIFLSSVNLKCNFFLGHLVRKDHMCLWGSPEERPLRMTERQPCIMNKKMWKGHWSILIWENQYKCINSGQRSRHTSNRRPWKTTFLWPSSHFWLFYCILWKILSNAGSSRQPCHFADELRTWLETLSGRCCCTKWRRPFCMFPKKNILFGMHRLPLPLHQGPQNGNRFRVGIHRLPLLRLRLHSLSHAALMLQCSQCLLFQQHWFCQNCTRARVSVNMYCEKSGTRTEFWRKTRRRTKRLTGRWTRRLMRRMTGRWMPLRGEREAGEITAFLLCTCGSGGDSK